MESAKPGQGPVAVEGGQIRKPSKSLTGLHRIDIDCCLDRNPKLATVLFIPTRRTHEGSTKRGIIPTRWLPLPPNVERTSVSSCNSATRQRALVGDSSNDEQWSDNLSDPPSH